MHLGTLFTDEEIDVVAEMDITRPMLVEAARHSTRELWFLAHEDLEPLFRGLLAVTPLEQAIGSTFYRILCCLRTLSQLGEPTQFQAISGTTRTCLELCMDVHLLTGPLAIARAAEKFHGFTVAARYQSAWKTLDFYRRHPELPEPEILAARRDLVETAGKGKEIEELCRDLWERRTPPKHWSGMAWNEIAAHLGPGMEARWIEWSSLYAWHIHGGGAGVGRLDASSFESIEMICRDEVRDVACDALELVARALRAIDAVPEFRARLRFVREEAQAASTIDQRLVQLGRSSKMVPRVGGN